MLNFRNTNIVAALLLVVLISIDAAYSLPIFPYILLATVYLLLLFYGSYYIGSGFYVTALCKSQTHNKKIALTFDDGPALYTHAILKILEAHQIQATFFCIGKQIEKDPDTLKRIYEAGHSIGNHSYSHCIAFDFWSTGKVREDLQKTHNLIEQITGNAPRWFRPPFGVTNPNISKAAIRMNYQTIGWSIRSMDTVSKNPQELFNRIIKKVHPGAIILLHDICLVTVDTLPLLIGFLREKNYDIVSLDKLLNLKPYAD